MKILTVLAIFILLAGWAFASQLTIESNERFRVTITPDPNISGIRVTVTPDSQISGMADQRTRQDEPQTQNHTDDSGGVAAERKQRNRVKANPATFPRYRNISPGNKEPCSDPCAERPSGKSRGSVQSVSVHEKKELIDFARSHLGLPYKLGGNKASGIDCSAFVKRVFGAFEIELPRTARAQFVTGTRIGNEELTAGDLIFFRRGRSKDPSHVGILLENDEFIHASPRNGGGVRIDSLEDSYYKNTFIGASRVLR